MNKHKELLAQVSKVFSALNIENAEAKALLEEVNKAAQGREKIVWTAERLEERRLAVNESSRRSKLASRAKAKGMTVEEYIAFQELKKSAAQEGLAVVTPEEAAEVAEHQKNKDETKGPVRADLGEEPAAAEAAPEATAKKGKKK